MVYTRAAGNSPQSTAPGNCPNSAATLQVTILPCRKFPKASILIQVKGQQTKVMDKPSLIFALLVSEEGF